MNSPKSILKKPNTAENKSRKQVHYQVPTKAEVVKSSLLRAKNSRVLDLQNSSYFKSEYALNTNPKLLLSARSKVNVKPYEKVTSNIMVRLWVFILI